MPEATTRAHPTAPGQTGTVMARFRKSHLVRQDVTRFALGTEARWRAERSEKVEFLELRDLEPI